MGRRHGGGETVMDVCCFESITLKACERIVAQSAGDRRMA
ncbi:hypothetical protein ACPOL_2291 [Acidisarcina polymorpha]|uniref:Uncharacterized protein n=1 Tax=Acidisarcina polymorpha TaxID=2211140 RepID=A0A2Z5FYX9_9BACT|nr:hypothetical protein ACPOL_2291 [Acidisarcina polymorpha]